MFRRILFSEGHKGCLFEHVHPLQHDSESCPTEEGRNREPKLSVSSLFHPRQLVRARPSSHIEDERKVLCESLNSSASNSQHSLTIPASPPQARSMIPWQPDRRVRQASPFHRCFHPRFFPSHLLTSHFYEVMLCCLNCRRPQLSGFTGLSVLLLQFFHSPLIRQRT